MALIQLTLLNGLAVRVNTDLIIAFTRDAAPNGGGSLLFPLTGPCWNQASTAAPGNATFSVTESPTQIAALWPDSYAPGSIPLSALATTGTPTATTTLHGNGAWS